MANDIINIIIIMSCGRYAVLVCGREGLTGRRTGAIAERATLDPRINESVFDEERQIAPERDVRYRLPTESHLEVPMIQRRTRRAVYE